MPRLLAPLLAGLGLGLYVQVRWPEEARTPVDVLLILVLLPALACWLALWLSRRRQRVLLDLLARRLESARERPSSTTLWPPTEDLGTAHFHSALTALLDAYQEALSRVVAVSESLAQLKQASEKPPVPARTDVFPYERSRRQMVARLTPNFQFQTVTPLLQQVLGQSLDKLLGRSLLSVVHTDDAPRLTQLLAETLKEGESHNVVFRLHPEAVAAPDAGRERYLQMDAVTYFDSRHRPAQLRCHFVDVTERILAEQQLRRRTDELVEANERLKQINRDLERLKESYRDLYHNAPVMYFSLDERGRLVAFNETLSKALGYPREHLLGQPYARLLAPGLRESFESQLSAYQTPGSIETRWVKPDGTLLDVWITISTVKDENGVFARSRCAATDVTEHHQLAEAVAGRARELEQANAKLRRINQELEEFTYVVSHDLKEPLRTLEAFSNFLAEDYGPQLGVEGREYVQHLQEASRRLGTLIDDLLTLSRAGRVINTPQPLHWDRILETVLADLRDLLTRKPNARVSVQGPLPAARGDPERVSQLLANLISNGLKYNDSAAPEIVIGSLPGSSSGKTGTEGPHVTLFVRDNGLGIEPRYHEQIFRLFRRLHGRDQYEGTGAGLAICKKVVEAHGGRIWVESAPGYGSTFYFTLPRGEEPAAKLEPVADRRNDSLTQPGTGNGQTVAAAG